MYIPPDGTGVIELAAPFFEGILYRYVMETVNDHTTVTRMVDDEHINEAIILAVAEARDVSPIELETPLYEAIDGEALESLFFGGSERSNLEALRVEFTWAGCTVVVNGTGRVAVTRADN